MAESIEMTTRVALDSHSSNKPEVEHWDDSEPVVVRHTREVHDASVVITG